MNQLNTHGNSGKSASSSGSFWGNHHDELLNRQVSTPSSTPNFFTPFTNIVHGAVIQKDVREMEKENREYEKLVNDLKLLVISLNNRTQELAQTNVDHETLGALHTEHEKQMKEYATKNAEYEKAIRNYNLYGRLMGKQIPQPPPLPRLSASLIPKSVHASGTPQHDVSGNHSTKSESHTQQQQYHNGLTPEFAARMWYTKNELEKQNKK